MIGRAADMTSASSAIRQRTELRLGGAGGMARQTRHAADQVVGLEQAIHRGFRHEVRATCKANAERLEVPGIQLH
jgi:hypothetical protein